MNMIGMGGSVLLCKRLDDMLTGDLLFYARRAGPVHEKTLSAYLATDITDGV